MSIPAGIVLVYGGEWRTILTGAVLGGAIGFPPAFAGMTMMGVGRLPLYSAASSSPSGGMLWPSRRRMSAAELTMLVPGPKIAAVPALRRKS